MALLEITGLRVEVADRSPHPGRVLLDAVDLSVAPGEVVGLIGESGAGKSTLALAALGHARAGTRLAAGRIGFDGQDLRTLPTQALRALRGARIAYAAQSAAASFNPAIRLGRQVAEPLVLHRGASWADALRKAASLFAELDLPEPDRFGERYPHQVSGGQLQRAMIAMAMVCEPSLLILDEPTTALDVMTQIEVLAAIRALLRQHRTAALYVSHDLAVVAQMADRMVVMQAGRIVDTMPAAAIAQPRHPYTQALVAALSTTVAAATAGDRSHDAPVLVVDDVCAGYGDNADVLRNVGLSLAPGRTLALVGVSGSGKSSLARVIAGLLVPRRGSVTLAGERLAPALAQRPREALRRVQFIHQSADTALNPRQRISTLLARGLLLGGISDPVALAAAIDRLLDQVGLPIHYKDRLPAQLSGGQRQRVGIARALAARPDLMICDEITSSLDPRVTVDIMNLLRRVQRDSGVALLFITHDVGVVRRIADQVAVLQRGTIVESGPADRVLTQPAHPHTIALLTSVPRMHAGWLDDVIASRRRDTDTEPRR